MIISYYQNSSEGCSNKEELLQRYAPELVTNEQNELLSSPPSKEEVKRSVFGLSPESAPGPDGYPGIFFTTCWEIVEDDVLNAVLDFFSTSSLPRSYTSSFLALIPKVGEPGRVKDSRPISLCHFVYKVIARLFNDRLATFLPDGISPHQGAFARGPERSSYTPSVQ